MPNPPKGIPISYAVREPQNMGTKAANYTTIWGLKKPQGLNGMGEAGLCPMPAGTGGG